MWDYPKNIIIHNEQIGHETSLISVWTLTLAVNQDIETMKKIPINCIHKDCMGLPQLELACCWGGDLSCLQTYYQPGKGYNGEGGGGGGLTPKGLADIKQDCFLPLLLSI